MKIRKLGHCCLVVEVKGIKILTDPGTYSTLQDEEKNIDIILITHEHADHFHLESLKKVLSNNQSAKIVTNTAVGKLLDVENIAYILLEDGEKKEFNECLIEGYGTLHAEIYQSWGRVQNTGYFIDGRLFYPGDAFYDPKREVEILALPVAGPWMKISEAVTYALSLNPKIVFPVHDGILKVPGLVHRLPMQTLSEHGIEFKVLEENKEEEF